MKRMKQEKVYYDDPETRRFAEQIRDRRSESRVTLYPYGPLWMMDPEIGIKINRR